MQKLTIQQARSTVQRLTDGLNKPVDAGIKDLVRALLCQGIETLGSCEGHLCRALPYPWVEIARRDIEPLRSLLLRAREDRMWQVRVPHPQFGRVLLRPAHMQIPLRRTQKMVSILAKKIQTL